MLKRQLSGPRTAPYTETTTRKWVVEFYAPADALGPAVWCRYNSSQGENLHFTLDAASRFAHEARTRWLKPTERHFPHRLFNVATRTVVMLA